VTGKRDRDTLHSCDLWDLPGGATGDECYERVAMKTQAREKKAVQAEERKKAKALKVTSTKAAALQYGSDIAGALTDASHLQKLTVPQLQAVLIFKAVTNHSEAGEESRIACFS